MKNSFMGECAKFLYGKHKEEISNLNILMPSRRATLFFNLELSKLIKGTPVWQPKFQSLDKIFSSLCGIEKADKLKLIVLLYSIYSKYHKESFDKFYYWGEMLISDFDTIDNYMIDAEKLYTNSADLRDIEERFDYLPDEDIEEINRFWRHFKNTRDSNEKDFFFNIWKTLFPIYTEFKAELTKENIGYSGMIYRTVADKLVAKEIVIDSDINYAVIGFNALSSTERVLFDAINESKNVDFLWDTDSSYLTNRNNEAGLFIRSNIKRYGESNNLNRDNYIQPKDITIVNSPSSSIECKYVWEFLEDCNNKAAQNGKKLGPETAIILTDESLLLPVLYSIPKCVDHFNVTAGYELKLTEAYSLCETLLSLQANYRNDSNGEFYYKNVESIITNPLIRLNIDEDNLQIIDKIVKDNNKKIYYESKDLGTCDFLKTIFTKAIGWVNVSDYLLYALNSTFNHLNSTTEIIKETKEAVFRTINTIDSLKDLITSIKIELNDNIFLSVLRKHLQGERISFEGEPLLGIQIMGILESRNLDFENVLILSVTEDNFPSKSIGASYIPSNLRHGYGLPTNNDHQAMYSYYFYRLLQRSTRADISYVSMTDGLSNGEPSRYIHQLRYAGEHNIKELNLTLDLTTSDVDNNSQPKDGGTKKYIDRIIGGKQHLSASSLSNYIQCPMKFYYGNVEGLREMDKEREIELGSLEMGNALHLTMYNLYTPFISLPHSQLISKLESITNEDIENEVNIQLSEISGKKISDFDATITNSRKFIVSYVSTIIQYDLSRNDNFTILGLEENIESVLNIDDATIKFKGQIDRLDNTPSGVVKIIDYKSGKRSKCQNIESLFDTNEEYHNKPVMQSILYSLLYSKNHNVITAPALYNVRSMNTKDFMPLITIKEDGEITRLDVIQDKYEEQLKFKLQELINYDIPFYKCNNEKVCQYCDYYDLCNM